MGPPCEHGGRSAGASMRQQRGVASMGPPCEHGGRPGDATWRASPGSASMGPPCEHGGRIEARHGAQINARLASMGPPCEHGGRMAADPLTGVHDQPLQWGRRVNTAEGGVTTAMAAPPIPASMGPPCEHGGRLRGRRGYRGHVYVASMGPPCEHGGRRRCTERRSGRMG